MCIFVGWSFSGTAAIFFMVFHTLHWSHCRISTWILFSMMYPQRFNSTGLFFPEKKVDTCHSFRFSFAVVLCTYHAKEIGAISSLDCVKYYISSFFNYVGLILDNLMCFFSNQMFKFYFVIFK